MVLVGIFPFETEEESFGEPYYTAPDAIDSCYRIHEIHGGMYRMKKTRDQAEVSGMRLQRRYQPPEFGEFLAGKTGGWPVVGVGKTDEARGEPAASPNGGPAEPLGNSGAAGGPPSVS
jgi:hypothetical protein